MKTIKNYMFGTIAFIGLLWMQACSDSSMGRIDYSKVTTGRMDLKGAVAVGLKTDNSGTRATDGVYKSGLYKIDDDGNITVVGLFVSINEDDSEYEHQEPLRVVPKNTYAASNSYFIASECEYFDKDDDAVYVPYKYLLVRKSDGKIWGIDDIYEYLFDSDGIDGRFKIEKGTLYFCDNGFKGLGTVYRFNLDTDIPSFEQVTKDKDTFADTFHIADDGVVFSYNNTHSDSFSTSGLSLSWPNAGWQLMKPYYKNTHTPEYIRFLENTNISSIDWEIVIPSSLIIDLISDELRKKYEFIEFRLFINSCDMEFSTINNRPIAFPSYDLAEDCLYVKYRKSDTDRDLYEFLYRFIKDASTRDEAKKRAVSYGLANGLMRRGYCEITYNATPLSAEFGNFHEIQSELTEEDVCNKFSGKCNTYEGKDYTLVVYNGHEVSRIDHNSGESKFLKKTENRFGYDRHDDTLLSSDIFFTYSGKLWNYAPRFTYSDDYNIAWFDPETLEEGRVKFSIDVPEYMNPFLSKFENGNLVFEGKNPKTGNMEYLYMDIFTGNARLQEIAPDMVFKTLIELN